MSLNNLFIDFNSYFASVEQQIKPELRNKPVGVVPVMADTTCCIAASYEAKAYGVKTGTMVSEARRLCPDIKFVEADHRTYIQYHNRLVDKVNECLPVDQVLSIDEMVCSLIGKEKNRENAIEIALRIKRKIKEDVGEYLRCSIGIAPNQFLAKTATDMQKPDGLVVIDNEDLPHCLYKLNINDLCGIGRRMEIRLHRHGIYTVEDLCKADKSLLRKVWGGIEGERMYDQLRGKIVKRPPTHRTTIGHSHVLPPSLKNNESAYAVLHRLLQKAAMRLRYLGYYAKALGVIVKYKILLEPDNSKKIKWKDYITFTATQNTLEFLKALDIMWNRNPFLNNELSTSIGKSIPIAVGVVLFNLLPESNATLPIFENFEKNESLYKAIDLLNRRYGYASVYFGGSHTARNSAPMRIAFTQIPNLEIEDDL
ncbi:DNA polymerase [Melioribacteraceae bacterium 4301-Me]|uniref:Y-family DNA polymerase n=1 Tax=Pyranulibacter aquaticus TaxID=3163344 RepID=UPI003598EBBC